MQSLYILLKISYFEAHIFAEILTIDSLMVLNRFYGSVHLFLVPSVGVLYELQCSSVNDLTYQCVC
jgi:hypothetical protein